MINFVYYCVGLLLIVCFQIANTNTTNDYSNGSPETLPIVEPLVRHKIGSDVVLKCEERHNKNKTITWEFKPCQSDYKGVSFDKESLYKLDDNEWMKLDYNLGKKKLKIPNSSENKTGLYRCLHEDLIIKIFIVDIFSLEKSYQGPPPEVKSLIPSNSTVLPHSNLVIQCNTTSASPPQIIWFKDCTDKVCGVKVDGQCYCPIPLHNSTHTVGETIYISKLNIYNVRPSDAGIYACAVISQFGKHYRTVAIKVQSFNGGHAKKALLFLIPFVFVLLPVIVWLCYYRKKRKHGRTLNEQQKQLINKPTVQVSKVLEQSEVL